MKTLIYDTPVLYNQHMSEQDQFNFKTMYRKIFMDCNIHSMHDCSIGAGGSTLPLTKMGYIVTGSDLSENLLHKAQENFETNGVRTELFIADFREIGSFLKEKVDCIISTGNSLPHVDLEGFKQFLVSAKNGLNENGYIFFDLRNWDTIVEEHPIMHAVDPKIMTAQEHRSVYLLFNWHDDGSVSFIFATSIDRFGKHDHIDFIEAPVYYPLLKNDIQSYLHNCGYRLIRYVDMDEVWLGQGMEKPKSGQWESDFTNIQWYGVLAQSI